MERFVNDEDLYIECMQEFLCDESFENLKSAINNGNYAAAFEHAHNLKGVSGNLGLEPLYGAVSDLVERLRSKQYDNVNQPLSLIFSEMEKIRGIFSEK